MTNKEVLVRTLLRHVEFEQARRFRRLAFFRLVRDW